MFNTRNYPTKGKLGDKEYDIPAYTPVTQLFEQWKTLSRSDRVIFAEKIIQHINKEIETNK